MSFHEDSFHQYIDSSVQEKLAIIRILNNTLRDLVDAYDKFASPNEKLFRDIETIILKARRKIDGKEWTDRNFP